MAGSCTSTERLQLRHRPERWQLFEQNSRDTPDIAKMVNIVVQLDLIFMACHFIVELVPRRVTKVAAGSPAYDREDHF